MIWLGRPKVKMQMELSDIHINLRLATATCWIKLRQLWLKPNGDGKEKSKDWNCRWNLVTSTKLCPERRAAYWNQTTVAVVEISNETDELWNSKRFVTVCQQQFDCGDRRIPADKSKPKWL